MKGEYQLEEHVRLARRLVWTIGGVLLVAVLLALAWKIAQVSERRAQQATREYLASSLASLSAEHHAQGRPLDSSWRKRNPFALLRWQQDNYCGELKEEAAPQGGCWYWLPDHAWVLYQASFADGWTRTQGEVRAWRLLVVSAGPPAVSQSLQASFTLELEAVPVTELSAAGY